eukprot:scaffold11881_cov52-Phaeocystis_antarctica.AAC.11
MNASKRTLIASQATRVRSSGASRPKSLTLRLVARNIAPRRPAASRSCCCLITAATLGPASSKNMPRENPTSASECTRHSRGDCGGSSASMASLALRGPGKPSSRGS